MQLDWAEMPTRPRIAGRERRLRADLPLPVLWGVDGALQLRHDDRVVSRGPRRAFKWLGGVPRECVYDNLRSVVARRDGDVVTWNRAVRAAARPLRFHATACTPETPREKGSVEGAVRHTKTGFWPARRFGSLAELDDVYADWRDRVALPRRHATGRHIVASAWRLSARRCGATADPLRRRRAALDTGAAGRLPQARRQLLPRARGARSSARRAALRPRQVWIEHRGQTVARYARSYEPAAGSPRRGCAPSRPPSRRRSRSPARDRAAGAGDYAELCA